MRIRLQGVVGAAAVAGTLDLASRFALQAPRGIGVERVLQTVATGIYGDAAYLGGDWSATIGFLLHYTIMLALAGGYIFASRYWPVLWQRAVGSGATFGLMVFVAMNYIIVPLSAAQRFPNWTAAMLAHALVVHIVLVGLVFAWFARPENQ